MDQHRPWSIWLVNKQKCSLWLVSIYGNKHKGWGRENQGETTTQRLITPLNHTLAAHFYFPRATWAKVIAQGPFKTRFSKQAKALKDSELRGHFEPCWLHM